MKDMIKAIIYSNLKKDDMVEALYQLYIEGVREELEKVESLYLEFGDDPKQALSCVAEHINLRLNAKGAHSVDVNGNCNHGCC